MLNINIIRLVLFFILIAYINCFSDNAAQNNASLKEQKRAKSASKDRCAYFEISDTKLLSQEEFLANPYLTETFFEILGSLPGDVVSIYPDTLSYGVRLNDLVKDYNGKNHLRALKDYYNKTDTRIKVNYRSSNDYFAFLLLKYKSELSEKKLIPYGTTNHDIFLIVRKQLKHLYKDFIIKQKRSYQKWFKTLSTTEQCTHVVGKGFPLEYIDYMPEEWIYAFLKGVNTVHGFVIPYGFHRVLVVKKALEKVGVTNVKLEQDFSKADEKNSLVCFIRKALVIAGKRYSSSLNGMSTRTRFDQNWVYFDQNRGYKDYEEANYYKIKVLHFPNKKNLEYLKLGNKRVHKGLGSTLDEYEKYKDYTPSRAVGKPIIYLYPEKEIDLHLKLNLDGKIGYTYPKIKNNSWQVKAYPSGRLVEKESKRELYSIFWDGQMNFKDEYNDGFIVKSENLESFFEDKLSHIGLNYKEMQEFIVYWAPRMKANKTNFIRFSFKEYQSKAKLKLSPIEPETSIRFLMMYKNADNKNANMDAKDIVEQKLPSFERKGFTLVEWGGTNLDDNKGRIE